MRFKGEPNRSKLHTSTLERNKLDRGGRGQGVIGMRKCEQLQSGMPLNRKSVKDSQKIAKIALGSPLSAFLTCFVLTSHTTLTLSQLLLTVLHCFKLCL